MRRREKKMMLPAILALLALTITILTGATIRTPTWTDKQEAAHAAAEILRAAGVEEEHESIQALKGLWWSEHVEAPEMPQDVPSCTTVSQDVPAAETPIWELTGISRQDYCTMAYTVWKEAGEVSDIELPENAIIHREFMRAVARVLLNRVESDRFPATVVECVRQYRQYNPNYVTDTLDGIPQDAIDAVDDVLMGNFTLPPDALGQAQFVQGEIVETYVINTGYIYSVCYICKM